MSVGLIFVHDHRQTLGAAAGALENAREATGDDLDLEALVCEGVLRRPHEGADRAARCELQVIEPDPVVLRHVLIPFG